MAQETTERATDRRRAALTFGADAAALAAAGFVALAALAGRGLAPGAAGEARVAVAAPWLDPWLIWARLGEGRGPLPLSPLRLAGRGRDALLGELLAEPTLAGADPEALPAAVALAVARARTGKGDLDGALGRVRALDAEGRVPQTFFAEGWAAAARGDAKARADALARLRRLWPSLAADPEGRADAEALAAALGAAGP